MCELQNQILLSINLTKCKLINFASPKSVSKIFCNFTFDIKFVKLFNASDKHGR